jgi:hypothetical protein
VNSPAISVLVAHSNKEADYRMKALAIIKYQFESNRERERNLKEARIKAYIVCTASSSVRTLVIDHRLFTLVLCLYLCL